MHIRNSFGAAGAAMLGIMALLMSSGANAVIDLDATATNKSMPSVTYAKETVTTLVPGVDGAMYYKVSGGDVRDRALNVVSKVGVGGTDRVGPDHGVRA